MEKNNSKTYPLPVDSKVFQKFLVFLPAGTLTLSMVAMNTSIKNLINLRLEDINLPGLYAILTVILTLCTTIAGPIGGKLSDVLGRKKTALIGLALYALATFAIGTATSSAILIVAYVILGLSYGTVNPLSSAMIADVLDKKDVPGYIGTAQSLMSLGGIIIPYFSGWLSDIFQSGTAILSLLIFSIASWLAILLLFPDLKKNDKKIKANFDWAGLALMFFFVAPLSIGLTLGGEQFAWISFPSIAIFAVSLLCLIFFIRHIKTKDNALIDIRLFKIKSYVPIILVVMLCNPTVQLIGSYLIRYSQTIIGYTAAQTASWSIRRIFPVILAPIIGVWLSKRAKYKRAFVIGGVIEIISVGLLAVFLNDSTPGWVILASLCLFQAGTAFENTPSKAMVANAMPADMRGSGLAIMSYASTSVSTICVAIYGVLYNSMEFNDAVKWMIYIALACLIIRQIIAMRYVSDPER